MDLHSSCTLFTRMVCSSKSESAQTKNIMDTAHPRGAASHPIHPPLDQPLDCTIQPKSIAIACRVMLNDYSVYLWNWTFLGVISWCETSPVMVRLLWFWVVHQVSSGLKKLQLQQIQVQIASLVTVKICATIGHFCGWQMFHLMHSHGLVD